MIIQGIESRLATFHAETCVMFHKSLFNYNVVMEVNDDEFLFLRRGPLS